MIRPVVAPVVVSGAGAGGDPVPTRPAAWAVPARPRAQTRSAQPDASASVFANPPPCSQLLALAGGTATSQLDLALRSGGNRPGAARYLRGAAALGIRRKPDPSARPQHAKRQGRRRPATPLPPSPRPVACTARRTGADNRAPPAERTGRPSAHRAYASEPPKISTENVVSGRSSTIHQPAARQRAGNRGAPTAPMKVIGLGARRRAYKYDGPSARPAPPLVP